MAGRMATVNPKAQWMQVEDSGAEAVGKDLVYRLKGLMAVGGFGTSTVIRMPLNRGVAITLTLREKTILAVATAQTRRVRDVRDLPVLPARPDLPRHILINHPTRTANPTHIVRVNRTPKA